MLVQINDFCLGCGKEICIDEPIVIVERTASSTLYREERMHKKCYDEASNVCQKCLRTITQCVCKKEEKK